MTRWCKLISLVVAVTQLAVLVGCRGGRSTAPLPKQPPWFEDITDTSGLHFVHHPGPSGSYFMPQIMGSGAALIDYDQDGRLDIFLIQGGGLQSKKSNRLIHQRKDGKFEDVSAGSGLDISGFGTGAAVGDVNNDGWPDLLLTSYGEVRLFLNDKGNGSFTDITRAAGLQSLQWGTSAAFFDYDRDGWLDLVIVNYLQYDSATLCNDGAGKRDFCAPHHFPGSADKLYRNAGSFSSDKVRFEDVTDKSGIGALRGPGLGVLCADFNGDAWPDIFVANDGKPNRLWINQKNGTFANEAYSRGLAYNGMGAPEADMGIAFGDVDGNGLFDVFSTHVNFETHTFWLQTKTGFFQDRSGAMGLTSGSARSTGFGAALGDFDLDGDLDLAYVNGRISRDRPANAKKLGAFWSRYAERNRLFSNDGKGMFTSVSESNLAFCGEAMVGRGLACGDIDNDGSLDLLATHTGSAARLYHNVAPKRGNWLVVRAIDPHLKRDAYGAEITVHSGRKNWTRPINPGYSYLCSNDPRAHFGLGDAKTFERIVVRWPDGAKEFFPAGGVNRFLKLTKGAGKIVP